MTIQRDLYYGYDTLMENVSDPSHIDFAHHKVTGRRDRAKPLPFKVQKSGPWGFAGTNNDNPTISSGFYPPCYFYNKYVHAIFYSVLDSCTSIVRSSRVFCDEYNCKGIKRLALL